MKTHFSLTVRTRFSFIRILYLGLILLVLLLLNAPTDDIQQFFKNGDILNPAHSSFTWVALLSIGLFLFPDTLSDIIYSTIFSSLISEIKCSPKRLKSITLSGKMFFYIPLGAAVEEFLFRWIFLWALPLAFPQEIAFKALFVLSVILFGLLHITNFQGSKTCYRLLRVVPHTCTGIILAYVFIKYGFFAAVIYHSMRNWIVYLCLLIFRISAPKTSAQRLDYQESPAHY